MVRLKENNQVKARQFTAFQFHYGTIKSFTKHSPKEACSYYFNSTMVRLKANMETKNNNTEIFQFHYGTIKSAAQKERYLEAGNFNSTMVRLKGGYAILSIFRGAEFQFHYGTIKRKRFKPV